MNWWPKLKCPACGAVIPNTLVRPSGPITCPSCSQQLQIKSWYGNLITSVPVGMALLLSYVLGMRGLRFVFASVVLYFPLLIAWTFIFVRVIPSRFEPYKPRKKADPKESSDSGNHSSSLDLFDR
jgi:hypothetical protein